MTSKLTRERLEEIVSDPMINQGSEFAMLARMALAAMDSEPVIVVGDDGGDALSYRRLIQSFEPGTKLYRHAQQPVDSEPVGYLFHNEYGAVLYSISDDATEGFSLIGPIYSVPQPAPVVPDGYVMVPKEPTEEMLQASYREAAVYSPTAYRAMIAAAPQEGKQ